MHAHVHVRVDAYEHIHITVNLYVRVHVYVHVHVYAYAYVHVYEHEYVHADVHDTLASGDWLGKVCGRCATLVCIMAFNVLLSSIWADIGTSHGGAVQS